MEASASMQTRLIPGEKPTLQQIRQQTKTLDGQTITRQLIADRAAVSYGDVYLIDTGGHLSATKVKKVLRAFQELSGIALSINDIKRGGFS
jgi:predicted transcriptional regulator